MENKGKKEPDNYGKIIREIAPYMSLGLQLAATVTVMVFLGIWLDEKFNTNPFLTVFCSFLGVSAALYNFIKTVIKSEK